NIEAHGKLGLKRVENPFAFAGKANLVPLTVAEISHAALSVPIIFVGDGLQPAAVMGLRDQENLFIDSRGVADYDAYLPAFVRRYPFVFANDDKSERMILCIDRDSSLVEEGGEIALFNG